MYIYIYIRGISRGVPGEHGLAHVEEDAAPLVEHEREGVTLYY